MITRKEYEEWLERNDKYLAYFGTGPFDATFESMQKEKINRRSQALETLDIEYLEDILINTYISHFYSIGFSLAFELKPQEEIDNSLTVISEVKEFPGTEYEAELDRFYRSLPEWAIEFLEDIKRFLPKINKFNHVRVAQVR